MPQFNGVSDCFLSCFVLMAVLAHVTTPHQHLNFFIVVAVATRSTSMIDGV